jgi:hypothetical protein
LSDDTVFLSTGETIQTKNLIWAAGVSAIVFEGIPAESYGRKTNGYRCVQQGKRKQNIYAINMILVYNLLMAVFLMDIHTGNAIQQG